MSYCDVCFLQPYSHMSGKGLPLGYLVCDIFLCFCHFPIQVLGQMWYLSVSMPGVCSLPIFFITNEVVSSTFYYKPGDFEWLMLHLCTEMFLARLYLL